MNYKEAQEKADKIFETIGLVGSHDFTVNKIPRIIAVNHFDGSYLEFHSACFRKIDDEWMAVFTEHHGMFVYHFEDVKTITELNEKRFVKYLYQYKE